MSYYYVREYTMNVKMVNAKAAGTMIISLEIIDMKSLKKVYIIIMLI